MAQSGYGLARGRRCRFDLEFNQGEGNRDVSFKINAAMIKVAQNINLIDFEVNFFL